MKTKFIIALALATTSIALTSWKNDKKVNTETYQTSQNVTKQIAVKTFKEQQISADGPAVETFYDITISIFSPIEFHEVFCALPATNCLKTVVITPTPTVNKSSSEDKTEYKYEFRSEKISSAERLASILPFIDEYPSFQKELLEAGTVKSKIVTDYKTRTKYLQVYVGEDQLIFAAPVGDEFVNDYDSI